MDNKRQFLGILIMIIGLLLLVGIVYIIFFHNFNAPAPITAIPVETELPVVEEKKISTLPKDNTTETIIQEKIKVNQNAVTEDDLKRISGSFAARFGSFSNQSGYVNIRDLQIFMSQKMISWSEEYIKEEIAKRSQTEIYYGITTTAVAEQVQQFDDDAGKAKILVSTRRREAIGTQENSTRFSQNLLIVFIKEKGLWKVDSANWQDQ